MHTFGRKNEKEKTIGNLGVDVRTILKRNFEEMECDHIDCVNLTDNSIQWLDIVNQDNEPSGIIYIWWRIS